MARLRCWPSVGSWSYGEGTNLGPCLCPLLSQMTCNCPAFLALGDGGAWGTCFGNRNEVSSPEIRSGKGSVETLSNYSSSQPLSVE